MKTPFMSRALWSEPASHPLMSISGAGFREEGKATQSAQLHPKAAPLGLSDPSSAGETYCSPAAASELVAALGRERGICGDHGWKQPWAA